jgi:quercetin dioxygenase-like cupin family protein
MSRKEELERRNLFEELLALRDQQREQKKNSIQVVKGDELPWETNRQGKMRWYVHPTLTDLALQTIMFYAQEIPPGSRSGRQLVQSSQVLYVWEGQGYTEVDGQRHDWEAGDLINLPLLTEGVVVQHFNTDSKNRALLVAAQPNYSGMIGVDMGSGFEQLENAPEYERAEEEVEARRA